MKTEPTIDEMIEWLEYAPEDWGSWKGDYKDPIPIAIRAILEQVKLMEQMGVRKQVQLEAIRAFVERVEHRIEERYGFGLKAECKTMREELAAMERETQ